MSEVYNVTIEITCVETERLKKLQTEVWRIRRMVQLMLDIADEEAVYQYAGVMSSVEKVGE